MGVGSVSAGGAPPHEARFDDRLAAAVRRADSLVCIGLDPDPARLPATVRDATDPGAAIVRFNAAIIEATHDLVCAYKPNLGFYVALGSAGIAALVETRRLIPPGVPAILDCKVADIGSTAEAYARGYYDRWDFDAVTVNPYLGEDALAPFLNRGDRGVFVLAKTSNPGSGEFQDVVVCDNESGKLLHQTVADRVASWSVRAAATIGLVVGATYPSELAAIRGRCPDLPILLPGVGAQAGDLAAAVRAGLTADGTGLLVTSSRSVIYAGSGPDFAERARDETLRLREAVNAVRRLAPSGDAVQPTVAG